LIVNHWQEENKESLQTGASTNDLEEFEIPQDDKTAVKEILLTNMVQKPYRIRNLICHIIAQIAIYEFPDVWDGFLDKICDGLAEDDTLKIDISLRILLLAFKPDEKYHRYIDKILENLFTAFTG
jgi:hypothetical protein